MKATELEFIEEAEPHVGAIQDDNALSAIVAHTHDLKQQNGVKSGNLFFEMNRSLRDRTDAGRIAMMSTWGPCVHYTLKGLAPLPNYEGLCYRGFPASEREGIRRSYRRRRPIQWGAFTSTTTNLDTARAFAGDGGVVFKIDVATGKDICPISFFQTEAEILLSPNHKFVVTSEDGGYEEGGRTMIEMLETEGTWFVS